MAKNDLLKIIEDTCDMYSRSLVDIEDYAKLLILAQTCLGNIAMLCRGARIQKLKENVLQ